jgi:propanol-preferring alcohol dehydrogenase
MKAGVIESREQPVIVRDVPDIDDVGPSEVLIDVAAAGICHTDLHIQDGLFSDIGIDVFPVIPGHETCGVISRAGSDVTHLSAGDRVAVYWIYPCGTCRPCLSGEEQACTQYLPTLDANGFKRQGGYATQIKVPASHALPVPEGLAMDQAAPLMCSGLTVYAGFKNANLRPSQRVAVLGIGGLGHLAIQIARAMGAEVIAATSSEEKAELATSLGADDVVVGSTNIGQQLRALGGVDVILSTTLDSGAIAGSMQGLNPLGTLVLTGLTAETIPVTPMALAFAQQRIVGSLIGSRRDAVELMDLAAHHHIAPLVERFPLEGVNEAFRRLRKNDIQFRAVISPKAG